MNDLQRDLGRMEGKLDAVLAALQVHAEKVTILENRVTDLEKKVMYAAGVVSVVVFVISSFGSSLLKKIGLIS